MHLRKDVIAVIANQSIIPVLHLLVFERLDQPGLLARVGHQHLHLAADPLVLLQEPGQLRLDGGLGSLQC